MPGPYAGDAVGGDAVGGDAVGGDVVEGDAIEGATVEGADKGELLASDATEATHVIPRMKTRIKHDILEIK